MFPPSNPTSQIGQLESEIRNLKSEIRTKTDNYEINVIRNKVSSLEHSAEEFRSQIGGL